MELTIKNCIKNIIKFIGTTFVGSFLGIIFVAFIFKIIYCLNPSWYESLTLWANQKEIPSLDSCKFKKLKSPNYSQLNAYSWYEMKIYLSNDKSVVSTLIYPINDAVTIQKNTGQIKLATTKDEPYLVLWKIKPQGTPSIRLQVKNDFLKFKDNKKYPYYKCPIKAEVFIDE